MEILVLTEVIRRLYAASVLGIPDEEAMELAASLLREALALKPAELERLKLVRAGCNDPAVSHLFQELYE